MKGHGRERLGARVKVRVRFRVRIRVRLPGAGGLVEDLAEREAEVAVLLPEVDGDVRQHPCLALC